VVTEKSTAMRRATAIRTERAPQVSLWVRCASIGMVVLRAGSRSGSATAGSIRSGMFDTAKNVYARTLEEIREAGLFKEERTLTGPQAAVVHTGDGRDVLNFCANNYLGLSSHPAVIEAAKRAIDSHGFGLSSVRFICGTQDLHKALEAKVAHFFGFEDTILYSSCFDANGGLFETLLGEDDAIISDALNHASIIDGVRLCKAERHRYPNGDMAALEDALKKTQGKRLRMVATDGVFSMDGTLARLDAICDLAETYGAMVMVDDSHATGFIGPTGRGTPEACGVLKRIDVMTSTLGKALGGASGGFTTGRREIVQLLRQRSRPYLFSNTVAPAIVGASLVVFDLIDGSSTLRERVMGNAKRFRDAMTKAGFSIKPGIHPIVPIMLGDARLASEMAAAMLAEGIYVIGFSYPVVPKGEARIRVQLSAAHEPEHVDRAVDAFTKVGKKLGVL
jgi:glycine C-acetyltransferase